MSIDNNRPLIAKEGYPFIVGALAVAAVCYLICWHILGHLLLAFAAFSVYFFRDPRRPITAEPNQLVSPADGKVVEIIDFEEPHFFKGPTKRISVFLNVFNVHVNRIPLAGRVELVKYCPGSFLPAYKEDSSELNERNMIAVSGPHGQVLITQIAGLIARRIVCWVKPEQSLDQGEHVGLIRFGSRVDIFVPPSYEIHVKVGDIVTGGITIIGKAS